MKTNLLPQSDSSGVLLTGTIFLASFDYSGFTEYAIKTAIGGLVWMGFKLTTDYITLKIREHNNRKNPK